MKTIFDLIITLYLAVYEATPLIKTQIKQLLSFPRNWNYYKIVTR